MPDKVISKVRSSSWGGQIVGLIFVLPILGICISKSFDDEGHIDLRSAFFWISLISLLALFIAVVEFIFIGRQKLTVSKDGIKVTYGLQRNTWHIKYSEIEDFNLRRVSNKNTVNTTGGFYLLEIVLIDGSSLVIDQNEYDNFKELKALIYHYKQLENGK